MARLRGAAAVIEIAAWLTVGSASTIAALHLAAPVLTPRGRERRAVALAKRGFRRVIPRTHPQAETPYSDPDAGVEA